MLKYLTELAVRLIDRWSGQVLKPDDHVAFIGRNPDGAKNVYMASGDSGQGLTHGTIAGILLTDLIMDAACGDFFRAMGSICCPRNFKRSWRSCAVSPLAPEHWHPDPTRAR